MSLLFEHLNSNRKTTRPFSLFFRFCGNLCAISVSLEMAHSRAPDDRLAWPSDSDAHDFLALRQTAKIPKCARQTLRNGFQKVSYSPSLPRSDRDDQFGEGFLNGQFANACALIWLLFSSPCHSGTDQIFGDSSVSDEWIPARLKCQLNRLIVSILCPSGPDEMARWDFLVNFCTMW